jgi:DNA-binding transcriptional regulator GbsR (MarR family)
MTREEMLKKVEELKRRKFFLAMKDHWTVEDSFCDDRLTREIRELNEALKEN